MSRIPAEEGAMSGVDKAAVLGAGTMGHGIAQVLAMAGLARRGAADA